MEHHEVLHKIDPEKLSLDIESFQHSYQIGVWVHKARQRYDTRVDKCLLCGCERHMLKSAHTQEKPIVSQYWRGKMQFTHETEPECWGSPNPT